MPRRGMRGRATMLAALLLAGSAGARAAASPEEAPTPGEAITRAASAVRSMAGPSRLILLGEFHGTREIPLIVARLADAYAEDGPVRIALEVDRREQPAIEAYLRSDGGPAARAALQRGRFWQRADDQHSALATHDLLDLIERVRRLRVRGRDASVLAYDIPTDAPRTDRDARDRAMAARVRAAFAALPRGRLLMLTGNVHAMQERPRSLPDEAPRPAGTWLLDLDPFSVRLMARGGYSWACGAERCGPRPADGRGAVTGPVRGPYDALVVLPSFSVGRLVGAGGTP